MLEFLILIAIEHGDVFKLYHRREEHFLSKIQNEKIF